MYAQLEECLTEMYVLACLYIVPGRLHDWATGALYIALETIALINGLTGG